MIGNEELGTSAVVLEDLKLLMAIEDGGSCGGALDLTGKQSMAAAGMHVIPIFNNNNNCFIITSLVIHIQNRHL